MSYQQNLTPTELDIIDYFPATYAALSDEFGFSESTARDHISSIERKGAPLAKRRIDGGKVEAYMRDVEKEHPTNQNETREYGSTTKATKTKRLNKTAGSLSRRLDKVLNNTEPAISAVPLSEGGEEDVVIHVTDDHIGDVLENEFGNEVFNTEIALERIRYRTQKTLELIERQRKAGWDFHTVHYVMGGDIITGSGIYRGQAWEVELNFNEQVDLAAQVHFEQIRTLAENFDAVQVVCQTGNHGEIRINGSSQKANGDDIVYRMLDAVVRASEYENITFIRNDRTGFTNFEIRGHKAHIRHGQNAAEHIGTSAAKRDWRGWLLQHDFDIAYAGHYHTQGVDRVMNVPVIRSGSIKPPGDFEESIAEWSMPGATIHGVSDSLPLTWLYDVQYQP
ncbi:metallo-dependent phosphatase domain protein [Halophage HF1]|uniref:Metallo-dependent phosphatase domain protein n=2 Tax=Haloferacalesvirus TaxID=2843389 RepID=Q8V6R5_9CAUD|nr:exonuclease [Halorubrum phage HF2]NP_861626.1 exonuclease [Halophage HF1]AAL54960.1 metallo-dependent phosphatase domain protein [Halorubrum phage HF2]AAO61337.1 metallo-dependent phosphatase domain protein [Halophage HF1]QIR31113.1 metallo-dependent phosphatase domain protein [Halorubrum virus Hardycor2]